MGDNTRMFGETGRYEAHGAEGVNLRYDVIVSIRGHHFVSSFRLPNFSYFLFSLNKVWQTTATFLRIIQTDVLSTTH